MERTKQDLLLQNARLSWNIFLVDEEPGEASIIPEDI